MGKSSSSHPFTRSHEETGFGKAWIYRLISQNRFPQPVKIGIRATAFVESEIDEWIQLIIENSRKHVA